MQLYQHDPESDFLWGFWSSKREKKPPRRVRGFRTYIVRDSMLVIFFRSPEVYPRESKARR